MTRCITRTLMALITLWGGHAHAADGAEFDAFLRQFRAAVAAQDAPAVASMTRLPFLYEGEALARDGVAGIVPALFTPAVRHCFVQAAPLAEEDAQVVFCPPYAFYFRADAEGRWAFDTFGADGEDVP